MKTYSPKPRDIQRRWYVIDASGAVLGRLATEVAAILRGKHKPIFAPHMDTGDHVIVVNARGVQLTGGKERSKVAYRHSGYPGGLTATSYERLLRQKPHFAVEKAVKGMLPKNRLGRAMARKLQVYPGPDHPHQAQQPRPLRLGEVPKWEGLPESEPTKAPKVEVRAAHPSPAAMTSTAKRSTAKSTAQRTAKSTAKSTAVKSTAKRTTAKSTAKATAKTTAKTTAKSTAKSTAKTAAKSTAKSTAKSAAKRTAKSTAKSSAKRRIARRTKKED